MAMGECSVYSSLQADFAAWPTTWRPPGAHRLWPRRTTVNSRIWLALYRQQYIISSWVLVLLLLCTHAAQRLAIVLIRWPQLGLGTLCRR